MSMLIKINKESHSNGGFLGLFAWLGIPLITSLIEWVKDYKLDVLKEDVMVTVYKRIILEEVMGWK